ncbi:MAG: hypothetical protein COW24_04495 [Candidatus Kerfeldbacteria bacterium CG15_BIG_FIL_POST_REV_8_21_14_020_45_12]|uniref:Amine oxidase domain-containing protein n=1 Tax=Candidatus Kerfeldbacteria bacterium CG15_BIG_FIL_POST_REV_8_21_14_020_45_12 TaxID=2014247 RepID=A0A2M7H2Y1_9BACT|nr:MAG: hypothetical protein COW24_04495 [Candidatus Kerfeldbacteria bacterium CG15_BIG_FIL_POST_REV_8_21_14_020_45_12]PJA93352.1 MAG: hypothetical protein CO132_03270 [Candidatus Kerfeldbacteria bacterium CG_4_9_14_3_um_filter_45_8]
MAESTVIIGGGIAGIAAARTLQHAEIPFTLVTPQWGGRIETSQDGHTNYGAYILPDTSRHILQFATKGRRIHPLKIHFHNKKKSYRFASAILKREWELWRLLKATTYFQEEFLTFRDQCLTTPQDEALRNSEYLFKLYNTPAEEWIQTKRIANIVYEYIEEAVYMCTFTPIKDLNAFDLMQIAMYIDIPVFEFELNLEDMIGPIKDYRLDASVELMEKSTSGYTLTLNDKNKLQADRVILAVDAATGSSLLQLKHDRIEAKAHMFHVKGQLKEKHEGDLEIFNDDSPTIFISRQEDGSHLFYSTSSNPELDEFFIDPQVIAHRFWDPAFLIGGHQLISMKQNNQLWLAGDYNAIGLENSYISGISAANQIIYEIKAS